MQYQINSQKANKVQEKLKDQSSNGFYLSALSIQ